MCAVSNRHSVSSGAWRTIIENDESVLRRVKAEVIGGWHCMIGRVFCPNLTRSASEEEEPLARIEAQIQALAAASPPSTLTVVIACPSAAAAQQLSRQRKACLDVRSSSVWSAAQEKQLAEAVKRAHQARVFLHLSSEQGAVRQAEAE